jgi:hypothetical protein
MRKLQGFDKFGINEDDDQELLAKLSLPVEDRTDELTGIAEEVSKRVDYESDLARYICYKMLADCNDHELALKFLRLCNEVK